MTPPTPSGRARRAAVLPLVSIVLALVPGAASSAAAVTGCSRDAGWAEMKPAWEVDVLALTNAHRASLGLGVLAPSTSLGDAARWKAAHMARYGYMSHDDPAPPVARTWDQRIRDCGYGSGAGENIAYGYRRPEAVFQGWLDSAGHRRNIENPTYKVIGVGAAVPGSGTPYWAQIFGTRVQAGDGGALPEPTAPPVVTEPSPAPDAAAPSLAMRDDVVSVPEDRTLRIAPLANDSGAARLTSVGDPVHGSVRVDGNEIVYVPAGDFNGVDSFTYGAAELQGAATVRITVEPRNDPPVAAGDRATARPRRTVVLPVVANDRDVDGDTVLLRAVVRSPYYGSVTVDPSTGTISYRPRRGTAGRYDRLTYRVSDGNGGVAVATVEVQIRR
ncbi:MAG: Ig-like domain-containing protein [Actinomycetota bacterium]|nr:Ig-like domain-containing protein [Actinomycetota bacterium]